ncbi:MAG: autotransporter-associated beta strand repeat-containing protein, partial [Chthoniobacteraceae bacterium]
MTAVGVRTKGRTASGRWKQIAMGVVAACALHGIGLGANLTWTGLGGDDNISNPLNWSPVRVPVAGDSLFFAGAVRPAPQLAAGLTVSALTFNAGALAFTLGGPGAYTINAGGLRNNSRITQTVNNAIVLGAAQDWNAASGALVIGGTVNLQSFTLTNVGGKATTIVGAISGTGGVTQDGGGRLTLQGNNAYSGTTTLAKGTLNIGSNTALGTGMLRLDGGTLAASGGSWTLANAAQVSRNFAYNSTNSLALNGGFNITANARLTVGSTGLLTLNGVVSGTRTLTKRGTGTLVLNGANTFSGGLNVSTGTVIVGNNAAAGTGTLTLGPGTLQAGGAARTLANAITLAPNGASIGPTFAGAYDLTFTGATALGNNTMFTVNNASTTFSGVISGGGGLGKGGTGTLTLSGANTYGGGSQIFNGTMVLNSATAAGTRDILIGDTTAGSTTPATLLLSSTAGRTVANKLQVLVGSTGLRTIGALNTTGVNTFSGDVTLDAGATLTADTGGEVNFTGTISGAGGITKAGGGTVRLSKANSFTGATLVSAGTLAYGISNAIAGGSVTIDGGTLGMGAFTDSVGAVTLENGAITGTGTLTSTSGFTVRNGSVSALLAGNVALTKDTAGTVVLTRLNTDTGATHVNAGTLSYGASNVLPAGALNVSGGTVDMGAGRADSVGAVTLASGSILGGAGSVLTSTSGFTLQRGTVTAGLAGAVALTKNTTGTVVISGANSYTGVTTISAGTLRLGATETLPNATATTIAAGATLDLNNFNDTVGSLAGA